MSYKVQKPLTMKQFADFIVKYNHNKALKIKETDLFIYALEPWEELNDSGELIDNSEAYNSELLQKEKERIASLKLTKREVFLALYKATGITPEDIKSSLTDPLALIEFEYAAEYYRGNPLIDLIGKSLGYSKEDLDYLFENRVLPVKETIIGGKGNA